MILYKVCNAEFLNRIFMVNKELINFIFSRMHLTEIEDSLNEVGTQQFSNILFYIMVQNKLKSLIFLIRYNVVNSLLISSNFLN